MAMRLSLRLSEEADSPQHAADCSMLSTTPAIAAAHGSRGLTMLTCMDTESPTSAAAAAAAGVDCAADGEGDCDVNGAPIFNSKRAKLDYFSRDCTAITEYLYVGGKKVASSQEKLVEKGITHIINAAGDVCDNYFPHKFHYLKLHLLDSAQEDIMCVLYKVIDFIDVVRKGKNKVLVHCQQGVSRSTVLVIAYLMYLENSDYDTVYEYVRARRGICRPNVGFMCQLLAWRKRVTRGSTRPHCMYRIGPHNARDKGLVTKWVDRVEVDSLDSRTLFLLQSNFGHGHTSGEQSSAATPVASDSGSGSGSGGGVATPASSNGALASSSAASSASSPSPSSLIYIWVGLLCPREAERQYIPYLAHLIAKVQEVEHAGKTVVVIRQKGREKIERAEALARCAAAAAAAAAATNKTAMHAPASPAIPLPPVSPSHARGHSGGHGSGSGSGSGGHGHGHVCGPAFSSEHISAAFHTLESAPAILSATSLSALYPAATAKQASAFYRTLGLEESDDYARVFADSPASASASASAGSQRRRPISGAVLINPALDDEYPDVRVPDIDALNEVALKHAGVPASNSSNSANHTNNSGSASGSNGTSHANGHRPYVLPPIVRVNVQPEPIQSDEEEEQCATDNDAAIEAYARNLCANSSASPLRFANQRSSTSAAGDSGSPALTFTLPRKLNLVVASPDVEPLQVTSARPSPPRLSLPSVADPGGSAVARPRLNLSGITFGGDDDAADCVMTTDTPMHTVPVTMAASASASASASTSASPALRPSAPSTSSVTPQRLSSLPSSQAPTPHMAVSPSATAAASSASVAATPVAASASSFALASPGSGGPSHCLFAFPNFECGPVACRRSSLVPPGIFVLHARATGALWVWLPGAGQLFIPSKYEGDREQFAGDIAKIFQLTFAADIRSVQLETAGKESESFLAVLDA